MKKNRGLRLLGFVLLLGACFLTAHVTAFAVTTDSEVLARVDVDDNPAYLGLPVYAHLQDGNGQSYVLVIADLSLIHNSGRAYQIIDENPAAKRYFLALGKKAAAYASIPSSIVKKYWDGKYAVILNPTANQVNQLSALGFELEQLSREPIVLQAPRTSPLLSVFVYDELVAGMMNRMQAIRGNESQYVKNLSGVNAVIIGGSSYTITTRNSNSGTPITKVVPFNP